MIESQNKMNAPFVSVVVPMYNSEETIENCINSLLNLDYPKDRYEIIVVDDHSTDNSAKIVSDFKYIHSNVRLTKQAKNKKGPAAARNLGIAHAKGELIASTDADEIMFPDWLNELLPYFSSQRIAAVGALLIEKHPMDYGLAPKIQSIIIDPGFKPGTVAAGNVIYRKKILREVGGFNEFCRFNDLDVDLHYRISERGYSLKAVQKYLGQHKQRHSLGAFYKRMRGFGAAGLIISFFNFKRSFFGDIRHQKGVLHYFALFLILDAYAIALIATAFLNIKIFYLLIFAALLILIISSLIWAGFRIKTTESSIAYLPAVFFYILIKLAALIQGVFYGLFYYIKKKNDFA